MNKVLFIIVLCMLSAGPVQGQRMQIDIDDALRANSERLKIKRKGIRSFGRYEFGNYKVISGKKGWGKSQVKSPLFGRTSTYKSTQKQHFVFVEQGGDTVFCNIDVRTSIKEVDHETSFLYREIFKWHEYEIQESFTSYHAVFSSNAWETDWSLIIVSPANLPVDVESEQIEEDIVVWDNKTDYKSILTNGETTYWLRRITSFIDNGKRSVYQLMGPRLTLGWEYALGREALAAVRFVPLNHMYSWMHNKLDKNQRLLLAAASTALCSRFLDSM